MPLHVTRARKLLKAIDFERLFLEELGWDRHTGVIDVVVGTDRISLKCVAQKRGMVAFVCTTRAGAPFPDYARRRKIELQVAKHAHEHLIVFVDADTARQVWQWVRRDPGQPAACREHEIHAIQSGDALLQKLDAIAFTLAEEETLSLTDVTRRAAGGFDVDKVTRRFFDRFQEEHAAFLRFIRGIAERFDREWYASLMLNRLMFAYFIQKKGFLDGDRDYLRNRLRRLRDLRGKDRFHSFYRFFLLRLFHEGLGGKRRTSELELLLGRIPYLNGGLFERHVLEQRNVEIQIPDEAFERIFDFFDQYQWHLDERPLKDDGEINPDVLGYIFEKYINQKQMGAYYTKEDITEYISRNVIVPFLFSAAARAEAPSFAPTASIWDLLRDNPDRYIHAHLRHGLSWDVHASAGRGGPLADERPLPPDIAAGLGDDRRRRDWNRGAPAELGLSTETWREVVRRRQHVAQLRAALASRAVTAIDELVTRNLDLRQFAEDVIATCEPPALLRAIWEAIRRITILDPTCGSGAFLFAALGVLEPLYEACLNRMERFVAEPSLAAAERAAFAATLHEVAGHPNRRYFVLKSIILNSLFGVDIMEEAVGICRLRLFLKLAAQVEPDRKKPNMGIEPLPDIDFNIRCGNTLVGYATLREVTSRNLPFDQSLAGVERRAAEVQQTIDEFRSRQTDTDGEVSIEAKAELRRRCEALDADLNRHLAAEHLVAVSDPKALRAWVSTHQPFHWCIQFFDIMERGGFDVIIGNPPYLEASKVDYRLTGYATQKCGDLYAYTIERSLALCSATGRIGMIVPISLACSDKFAPLRRELARAERTLWLSHFANRPGQLFTGSQNRLTIFLTSPHFPRPATFTTRYHRWDARNGEREHLFSSLRYQPLDAGDSIFHGLHPKAGSPEALAVLHKLRTARTVEAASSKHGKHAVYWVRVPGYFCQFLLRPPMCRPRAGGPARVRGEVNQLAFDEKITRDVVHAVLNSSLYYLFFCAYTDTRHINPSDVKEFPLDVDAFSRAAKAQLATLSAKLTRAYEKHTSEQLKSGLLIESIDSKPCKPILDEIDAVLAEHYRLTSDELDYVVNYDIKARLGATLDEED
ncbi:MAG: SAM-dependent methyltransferase [Kofleriaceae bacterium]|nr:MAG: SAM-dependent methyltransferase [Kofleriaceae bacterium]